MEGKLKVFTGSSNVKLAEDIVKNIGIELGKIKIEKFKDGEISVVIDETVRGYDIYIIQPTSTPVNDNLMELLIMIDAAKRASAGRINAVIPYYGYARQDRKTRGREPISAKLVADLLEMAGADRVISMDLHAGQIQGYFNIPVDHLSAVKTLSKYFKNLVKNQDDWVIVSPDLGGVTRARKFSNFLNLPIAIIEKRRPKPNVSEVMNIIGDIDGKNCIIIDDIIDTAGTITNAANALIDRGAKEVYITASHGVLSGPAIERIDSSVVKKCVITDTIDISNKEKSDKIDIDLLRKINIDIKGDRVFLNEKDVSDKIRNKEVTENVSWVSSIFLVRKYLVDMQRKISQNKSIILDGRDIGTVVFPNAKYKFFLVASSEVRAKRRYEQNEIDKPLEEIQKDIEKRDYLDSHREISPLKKAEDAIEIDSSNLTIDETIEEIINKMDKEDVL